MTNREKIIALKKVQVYRNEISDFLVQIIQDTYDRLEAAKEREQYQICHVITRLLGDSKLLMESDERNGKPYKLFGEPLTIAYGRLACQLYRAANIQRGFWLRFLKETHSDPKGIDKHLRRSFRNKRCR